MCLVASRCVAFSASLTHLAWATTQARAFADFLTPMLSLNPKTRATAAEVCPIRIYMHLLMSRPGLKRVSTLDEREMVLAFI